MENDSISKRPEVMRKRVMATLLIDVAFFLEKRVKHKTSIFQHNVNITGWKKEVAGSACQIPRFFVVCQRDVYGHFVRLYKK